MFSHPKVKPSNVVVDAVSMGLLKGSVIDFATELIGSSFRVVENPQVRVPCLPLRCWCSWLMVWWMRRRREAGVGAE